MPHTAARRLYEITSLVSECGGDGRLATVNALLAITEDAMTLTFRVDGTEHTHVITVHPDQAQLVAGAIDRAMDRVPPR